MKRTVTLIAALGLVVGACGGDDDSDAGSEAADTTEATAETTTPDADADADAADADDAAPVTDAPPADETDAGSDSDTADVGGGGDDDVSVDPAVDDGEMDDGESVSIRSLDDIPAECRDAMAEFLREIEPIVSDVDWENASLGDFQRIADDFTEISEDFDAATADAGCGNLDFTEGNEAEILIDFADDEAPGVVPFLEFINVMRGAVTGDGDAGSSGDAAFETCQDGIDFVQNLVDTYDTVEDVPASELLQLQNLTVVIQTCSLEELSFLESDEVSEFFGGEAP